MSPPNEGIPPARWGRADWLALGTCVLLGLLVALLPHLIWWERTGSPDWIMNDDELVAYLPLGAHSYHNHPWRTGDPTLASGGRTLFPWLQVIPGVAVARGLDLGPVGIALAWRILAGLLLPAGLFWVARFVAPPWVAAGIASVVMLDHGTLAGRVLDPHFRRFWQLATAHPAPVLEGDPALLLQWRVNPSITLPFLLLALGALLRARRAGSWPWIVLAGVTAGLLFHVLFYFWTAVALALVILWVADAGHRRVYFHAGWMAALIGLPVVLQGSRVKRELGEAWFQRFDMFVPIPRLSEFIVQPVAFASILVCLGWCWMRRRELVPLATVTAAAVLLSNQQVLSGLQIENFHWMYAWGPCGVLLLSMLAWVGLSPVFTGRRWLAALAAVAVGVHAAAGLGLRAMDAGWPRRMAGINRDWRAYVAQRAAPGAPAFTAEGRVAGDIRFGIFAQIRDNGRGLVGAHYYSQRVNDAELARIFALNAVLSGESEEAFLGSVHLRGLPERDAARRQVELERWRQAYRQGLADPEAGMDEYRVRYLALRRDGGRMEPPVGRWRLVQVGPDWRVWERVVGN